MVPGMYVCICSTALSDEENEKLFGPCNNLNGHGHNYKGVFLLLFSISHGLTSRKPGYGYLAFVCLYIPCTWLPVFLIFL